MVLISIFYVLLLTAGATFGFECFLCVSGEGGIAYNIAAMELYQQIAIKIAII